MTTTTTDPIAEAKARLAEAVDLRHQAARRFEEARSAVQALEGAHARERSTAHWVTLETSARRELEAAAEGFESARTAVVKAEQALKDARTAIYEDMLPQWTKQRHALSREADDAMDRLIALLAEIDKINMTECSYRKAASARGVLPERARRTLASWAVRRIGAVLPDVRNVAWTTYILDPKLSAVYKAPEEVAVGVASGADEMVAE